jgi:hypothetical protein
MDTMDLGLEVLAGVDLAKRRGGPDAGSFAMVGALVAGVAAIGAAFYKITPRGGWGCDAQYPERKGPMDYHAFSVECAESAEDALCKRGFDPSSGYQKGFVWTAEATEVPAGLVAATTDRSNHPSGYRCLGPTELAAKRVDMSPMGRDAIRAIVGARARTLLGPRGRGLQRFGDGWLKCSFPDTDWEVIGSGDCGHLVEVEKVLTKEFPYLYFGTKMEGL